MNGQTEIKKCDCQHKEQDKLHGKNNRAHNIGGATTKHLKCTVCGVKR